MTDALPTSADFNPHLNHPHPHSQQQFHQDAAHFTWHEIALISTTVAIAVAAHFILFVNSCFKTKSSANDTNNRKNSINMGVRSSKASMANKEVDPRQGKHIYNDALSSGGTVPVSGPNTKMAKAHHLARLHGNGSSKTKRLLADKRKFFDPSVIESMKHIDPDDLRKFDTFNSWLVHNGTTFPNLEYKQYADGIRGVHTTQKISAMVQIMAIPLKCLITDAMGRKTEPGKRLIPFEDTLSVPNHCQVIVYMMNGVAAGDTFYQPYYDVLPKNFNNFPIFWTKEQLGWLQGSSLVEEIEERKRNMRKDYDIICRAIPEFKKFSFKEFLWCRTAVGSRNFSIVVNKQKVTAMVPFADMLNHFRPRETSWRYDDSQTAFTMTSLTSLTSGHQVMDSYGKKCNSKFLLHYGFTIEDNREADGKCQNEVQIKLRLLPEPDPLRSLRLKFVHRTLITRISMNAEDAGTIDAFLFARVAVATEMELMYWINNADADQSPEMAINAENELRAMRLIAQAAAIKLAHYPDRDEKQIIAAEPPFSDRRHAAIVVNSEKQVLQFFIDLSGAAEEFLQLPPITRNRQVRARGSSNDLNRFLSSVNSDLLDVGR